MKEFRDTTDRAWTIAVTTSSIKRVRDLCKINLLAIIEDQFKLLGQLSGDPELLADVLYSICKPQAEERGVTDVQFGEALSGDALWTGFNALIDDLIAFFPDPRQRTNLQAMITKIRTATGILMDEVAKQLDAIDPSAALMTSNDSSTSSPASSASIPAP